MLDAFVNYSRNDEKWSGGQIRRLIETVAGELSLLTGTAQRLWRDVDDLPWGDDFEAEIPGSSASQQVLHSDHHACLLSK